MHNIFIGKVEIPCKGYKRDNKRAQVHTIYGLIMGSLSKKY
jgi:hypothetical protein